MRNHFHLVLETPQPNLVFGMKWLLGIYTKRFNIRHKLCGHLFGDLGALPPPPSLTSPLGRDGQLRRERHVNGTQSKQNRLKPHRGGMVASGAVHAAPTELEVDWPRLEGGPGTAQPGMRTVWR